MRPTPETTAFAAQYAHHETNWLAVQFIGLAKRLERELDEAREETARMTNERDHALRDRWKWEAELAESVAMVSKLRAEIENFPKLFLAGERPNL